MKHKQGNWLKAVENSLKTSLILTIFVSFVFSFTVFLSNHEHYYQCLFEFAIGFFGMVLYLGLGSILLTLISVGLVGTPTVYILKQLDIAKPIYAGIAGSLYVYLFMFLSEGGFKFNFLFFALYGFVCGFAFMKGYQKREGE